MVWSLFSAVCSACHDARVVQGAAVALDRDGHLPAPADGRAGLHAVILHGDGHGALGRPGHDGFAAVADVERDPDQHLSLGDLPSVGAKPTGIELVVVENATGQAERAGARGGPCRLLYLIDPLVGVGTVAGCDGQREDDRVGISCGVLVLARNLARDITHGAVGAGVVVAGEVDFGLPDGGLGAAAAERGDGQAAARHE